MDSSEQQRGSDDLTKERVNAIHLYERKSVLHLNMHLQIAINLHLLVCFGPYKGYSPSEDINDETVLVFGGNWTGSSHDTAPAILLLVVASGEGGECAAVGHTYPDCHNSAPISLFWSIRRLKSIRRHQIEKNPLFQKPL